MIWKLWLDDVRNPSDEDPENRDYIWARDSEQAKYYTKLWGPPVLMALDFNLGITVPNFNRGDLDPEDCLVFLRWLVDECNEPPSYIVNSADPEGRVKIHTFMKAWAERVYPDMRD